MSRIVGMALVAGFLVLAAGCANVPVVGRQAMGSGIYFGSLGITGDGNAFTVKNGSRLSKLSVIGNNNNITVDDLVTLPHVEFWGGNNTVSVPDYLMIRVNSVGNGNKIIRRQVTFTPAEEGESPYAIPRRTGPVTPIEVPTSQPAVEPAPEPPASPEAGGGEWIP